MDKPDPALVPAAAAPHVQALVTTGSVGASDALMASMPRLSLICCYGTGYERIDLAAARKRNIMVTHGADANAPDVAEMAFGVLLASTRRIVRADKMIRRGDWTKRIPNRFGAIAGLTGGKLGILGLGAIGMEFAKRAKGFDVEIGYCNRNKRSDVDFAYFPNVMALATWADYLIVCLRSDASNKHIINAEVLKALGPRGHLVNISRGWAVDEAALADALAQQRDRGRGARCLRRGAVRGPGTAAARQPGDDAAFRRRHRARPAAHDLAGAPEPRQPFRRQAGGLAAARAARHGGGSGGAAAIAHRSAGVPRAYVTCA